MTQLLGERDEHCVPAKQFLPYLELSVQNIQACPSISIPSRAPPEGPHSCHPFHPIQEEGHVPILHALPSVAFSLI